MNLKTYCKQLPKIDLHHHFDGAFRSSSLYKEAKRRNLPQGKLSFKEFQNKVTLKPTCNSLTEFLDTFNYFYDIPTDVNFLKKAAEELVEDLYEDNLIYAETRFAPHLFADENLSQKEIVKNVVDGLKAGYKKTGLKVNLILGIMRGFPLELVEELISIYHQFDEVVGLDLAGDESKFPGDEYKEVYQKANADGIPITIHAGEAAGPKSIWLALNELKASRIGHCVQAIEDEKLMQYLFENKISQEICLTSNLQTGTILNLEDHPIQNFYDRGLKITINTDDPSVSDIDLSHEWELAIEQYNLNDEDVKKILKNSADGSFVSENEKLSLKEKIENKMASLSL